MTPQNKLYEAAKAVARLRFISHPFVVLREAITAYEQEQPEAIDNLNKISSENIDSEIQEAVNKHFWNMLDGKPEAIAGEKTAKEILDDLYDREYRSNYKTDYPLSCILEAMQLYASQQTSTKDKEIKELKEAISELIQVKDWKDKYGKDEHYLKAMPIAWENVRKLIQK